MQVQALECAAFVMPGCPSQKHVGTRNVGPMNRRRFIQTTSVSAAGLASSLCAAEPLKKITVGFLGASHSHALEKFKVISQMPEFEFVGVADPEAKVREAFRSLNPSFINRDELFARAELIAVESAVREHARDARSALSAGRHVHLEKPPTATLGEFDELLTLAREKQRLLQVSYMWRHNPGFQKAIEAARHGWLGDV